MKIGAGGLQAMIAQDAARGLDSGKVKTPAEQAIAQSEDPQVRRQINELNKAIARMRSAAEAFNQPTDFEVKRGDRPRIRAKDRRTGAQRELTLEEAEEWIERLKERGGRSLDGYV